jgi:hypothetical protein
MENYETSVVFSGEAGRAVDFIAATLAAAGYGIESRTDTSLRAVGPKVCARFDNTNPLCGFQALELRAGGGMLTVKADLHNVNRAVWLVFGLAFLIGLSFALIAIRRMSYGAVPLPARLILVAPVLVLIVLPPMARNAARNRINRGLGTLLKSAAVMAGQK